MLDICVNVEYAEMFLIAGQYGNVHAECAHTRGHSVLILRHCGSAHTWCSMHVCVHCTTASSLWMIVLLNDSLLSCKSTSA